MACNNQQKYRRDLLMLNDYYGLSEVSRAVLRADLETVTSLLKRESVYAALNTDSAQKICNQFALHLACIAPKNRKEMITLLCANGANMYVKDEIDRTPFLLAANSCDYDVLNLFISLDLDDKNKLIHATDEYGRSMLHAVCAQGYTAEIKGSQDNIKECLELLLNAYDNKLLALKELHRADKYGITPAMYAKHNKFTGLYQIFLEHGINIDAQVIPDHNPALVFDYYGRTNLMLAFENNRPLDDIIKILSDENNNPMRRNKQAANGTFLHLMFKQQIKFAPLVTAVISSPRVNLAAVDANGSTMLHFAVRAFNGTYLESCSLDDIGSFLTIIAPHGLLNKPDKRGFTPLHALALNHNCHLNKDAILHILNLLKKFGADLWLKDHQDFTPLDIAYMCGNFAVIEAIEMLVTPQNINLQPHNFVDIHGYTMVSKYSYHGSHDALKDVLDKNPRQRALINYQSPQLGLYSALHVAATGCANRAKCVEVLINNGADLFARDNLGRTVFLLAANTADCDTLTYLLNLANQRIKALSEYFIYAVDKHDRNMLHAVCSVGSEYANKARGTNMVTCLRLLLKTYPDRDIAISKLHELDEFENSPFMYAKYYGFAELREIFNEYGINYDSIPAIRVLPYDYHGCTELQTLFTGIYERDIKELTHLVAKHPAKDLTIPNELTGISFLHKLFSFNVPYLVDVVLKKPHLKIYVLDNHLNSILHYATYLLVLHIDDAFEYFRTFAKVINQGNIDGRTPLHLMAMNEFYINYDCPLSYMTEACFCLLSNGAKPQLKDKYGHTALELARFYQNDRFAIVLEDAIANHNRLPSKSCFSAVSNCLVDSAQALLFMPQALVALVNAEQQDNVTNKDYQQLNEPADDALTVASTRVLKFGPSPKKSQI